MTTDALSLDDIRTLIPDWRLSLRAANKAPNTENSYVGSAELFAEFLIEKNLPTAVGSITSKHIEKYLVHLQERPHKRTGKPLSAAFIAKQYRHLQQFFRWLHEIEGEIESTPFAKLKPPAVPEQPVPVLTEDQLRALLKACEGNSFENRRDMALIRLFLDAGPRVGEVWPIKLGDVDFEMGVAHVLGKGRRSRGIPFGNKTAEALRRYVRVRARHSMASKLDAKDCRHQPGECPCPLWIGRQGALTEYGVRQILDRRAEDAGIAKLHPHMFRHTFAHLWLVNGGQEQDLMRIAGWRSREMVGRYGASAADERARTAHKRAALGDAL